MFELLMLAGFLYAGLVHLRPAGKSSDSGEKASVHRACPRHPHPPFPALRHPGRKRSAGKLGKSHRLC